MSDVQLLYLCDAALFCLLVWAFYRIRLLRQMVELSRLQHEVSHERLLGLEEESGRTHETNDDECCCCDCSIDAFYEITDTDDYSDSYPASLVSEEPYDA